MKKEVNARTTRLGAEDAEELASQVNKIYVIKGKRVTLYDMKKDPPDSETLIKALLGPTGNLRAPALRRGKTLVVGFDADTYGEVFGG